ncbi:MAG: hypothetical protein ACTTIC_01030 [Helicobacteraceae bacterium]
MNDVLKTIETKSAVMLYLENNECNVCKILRQKIDLLFSTNFPEMHRIYTTLNEEIIQDLNILSAPTIIIFFDGKEFLRFGKNDALDLIEQKLTRIYTLYFG